MTPENIIAKLASVRPGLQAEGVVHLALFGSRARQDGTSTSDLDLLIDVSPSFRFSILNLVGVEHIVQDATGIQANAFMRRSLDPSFKSSIAPDVIEVF